MYPTIWLSLYIFLIYIPSVFTISTTISTLCEDEETCNSTTVQSNSSEVDYDEDLLKNFLNISSLRPTARAPTEVPGNFSPKLNIKLSPGGNACPCDLLPSICDINCCCDLDCKEHQLATFSHCYEYNQATKLYDSRYCYRTDFIKKNRTDFILDRLTDNLFCISHDNLPPFYSSVTTVEVRNRRHFEELVGSDGDESMASSWRDERESVEIEKLEVKAPYVHGDLVRRFDGRVARTLDVLATGFTGLCSSRRSLKYLEEFQSFCLQTKLEESNEFLDVETFSKGLVIAKELANKNKSTNLRDSDCPGNVCVAMESIFCDSSSNCNGTTKKFSCTQGSCINVAKRVTYVIYHNGTRGIQRVQVFFEIGNVSQNFHQHFQVKYEWIDQSHPQESTIQRSGNPGYLIGAPIIIGALISANLTKTNTHNEILLDPTNSVLRVPLAQRTHNCFRNNSKKLSVGFGENIKTKCAVSITTDNFSTKSCIQLQEEILEILFGDSLTNVSQIEQYKIHVSKSSNISSNVTNWTQILLNKIPRNKAVAEVIGDQIVCAELIKSMRIDFLYSFLPKTDRKEHFKVIGVGITVGDAQRVHWNKCNEDGCKDKLKTEVVSYVVFHDISTPSMYYYAGGPNLDISLPYDFFYPFLSANSYSSAAASTSWGVYGFFVVGYLAKLV